MPDDQIPPELNEDQRMRQRINRDAAGSMFSDPDPDSRLAAWNQWQQTSISSVWRDTRDSMNVPDDAGEYAEGLRLILARIPPGRGRFINCDKGWFGLITELDSVLAQLDPEYVVQQVKEKFGRLAYYVASDRFMGFDNPFYAAKKRAQDLSVTICELCSAPGCPHETIPMGPPGRWVKTLCPACAAAGHRGRTYTPVEGS